MVNILENVPETDSELKICCANLYEHEAVKFFLGESFHPGGLELTARLAERLDLKAGDRVLDIASGMGVSALALAEKFRVEVVGLDLSDKNCRSASELARKKGVADIATFVCGDAEKLPFPDGAFSVVLSECSYCTFPDKQTAADEIYRVLRPGGRVGLNDVILNVALPEKWRNHIAHILCLADAKSFDGYGLFLTRAGFSDLRNFDESQVFIQLAGQIKAKLMLAQIAVGLGKLHIPEFDVKKGNRYIKEAIEFIQAGKAGYGMIIGRK